MKLLKKLSIAQTYLFSLVFLGITLNASNMVPISAAVWDDITLFAFPATIIAGILTILLSLHLFSQKAVKHKVASVFFILVALLFMYAAVIEFMQLL